MNIPFSGGCACGAIRYECTAEPIHMSFCHCRNCQRATGGPFKSAVAVPAEAFKLLRGSPRYSVLSGIDGNAKRGFCSDCGSPLLGFPNPEVVSIHAASLDDPSWFTPRMHIFTSHAQPWDSMNQDLPKFEEGPPQD